MNLFSIFGLGGNSHGVRKTESSGKEEHFTDTYILALVHKLRTPLNAARWALDSVIHGDDTDKDAQREILNEGYNKIISAINTVNEILKAAEMDSKDGVDLKKEKLNLCDIVDDILKTLGYLIKRNEIKLDYGDKCNPTIIFGDREMLELSLTNLFDNAFRYSPKGNVFVALTREGGMAKLVIKDDGIGIDKEDMSHLYEKFHRGKNAKVVDPNENGVGLYATKKIIEMHGGKINVDSELNKGTTVEVDLPID
jgi:signal transduction histidine kinase